MATTLRGTLALVGAGEYLPTMATVDKMLLEYTGGIPRVVVLPTAAVPDGPVVCERWAHMGVEYFTQLGVEVEAVMLRTHDDANLSEIANKLATANFVYFSGGKPHYLLQTLQNTLAWQAIQGVVAAGGVLVGCSAGAMVMGEVLFDFPQIWRTTPALRLAPGLAIIPHFNELPPFIMDNIMRITVSATIAGVDGGTALTWSNGQWTVMGDGNVTIFQGKAKTRYASGEQVPLTPPLA
jgi:cyanophycinase